MQTVEMYAREKIEKYQHFNATTALLIEEIPLLSPSELQNRCADLVLLQRELTDNNDFLCHTLEWVGPDILNTSYIGELQRAIDKSVLASASLYTELLAYRDHLPIQP
jgi:hypothetical protein